MALSEDEDADFEVDAAPAPPNATPKAGPYKPFSEKGTSQQYADAKAVKDSAEPGAILLAAKQTAKHVDPDIQYVLRRMTDTDGLAKKLKKWIRKDPSMYNVHKDWYFAENHFEPNYK